MISIYGLLKKHIKLLLSTNPKDANYYKTVKMLIMNCINDKYLKMNNPIIIMRDMADSLTILILSGIFYHWPTCIQDLINESMQKSVEFIYLVLRALGDIDLLIHYNRENTKDESYEDSIIISQKEKMQIKDKLIENKDMVINFLLNIYNNIGNFQNENLKKRIITGLFDTTKSWINFDLYFLKNINISKMIYSIINSYALENPEKFSNMICDSIVNSNNAKIYINIEADKNATPQELSQQLFKSIDMEEKIGIDNLLNFLLPKLEQYKDKINSSNEYERQMMIVYAKILASVIENYIYLFFNFSDERSGILLKWFQYFLVNKRRSISWLFFEGLDEMRDFINKFYKFAGLNNDQKSEFANYLMSIVCGVMENCIYKYLDQNDISLLEQEIICKSTILSPEPPKSLLSTNNHKLDELEEFGEDIDIGQYRQSAESVFYSIFFILIENFRDSGTTLFLNKILSTLPINEIKQGKNSNDPYLPIKIDVILYVLSSIMEVLEVENSQSSINIIHNLIKVFLDSKIVLENQRIFIDFLVLIDKFNQKLVLEQDNFIRVVRFLLMISKISKNPNIIEACYIVLLNISNELNDETKIDISLIINEIFNRYTEIYNQYQYPNIKPLENIIDTILTIAGINSNRIPKDKIGPEENNNYSPNLKLVIQQISSPINTELKNLIEKVQNNNQDINLKNCLRFGIVKGYLLQKRILASLKEFSSSLRNDYLQEHLNLTLNITKTIFEIFKDDKDVINPLIEFYTENASAIGECCHNNFNAFNNIMINYILSSNNHYKVIQILKLLYLSLIISIDKTDQLYLQMNKFILEQYNLIMSTFINYIKSENDINNKLKEIKEKIRIISEFHHYIFPKLIINSSTLMQNDELMRYYNLIQEVINLFINCINLFKNYEIKESVDEGTLVSVIKSFNTFFINISLQKDFFLQNNNNNSCLFSEIIFSLWNTIVFKQFNCLSRREIVNCYNNAIHFDKNLFENAFEKCISQSSKFTAIYIKSIMEYIHNFGYSDGFAKILECIIENIQGIGDLNHLTFFFHQIARKGLKPIKK